MKTEIKRSIKTWWIVSPPLSPSRCHWQDASAFSLGAPAFEAATDWKNNYFAFLLLTLISFVIVERMINISLKRVEWINFFQLCKGFAKAALKMGWVQISVFQLWVLADSKWAEWNQLLQLWTLADIKLFLRKYRKLLFQLCTVASSKWSECNYLSQTLLSGSETGWVKISFPYLQCGSENSFSNSALWMTVSGLSENNFFKLCISKIHLCIWKQLFQLCTSADCKWNK